MELQFSERRRISRFTRNGSSAPRELPIHSCRYWIIRHNRRIRAILSPLGLLERNWDRCRGVLCFLKLNKVFLPRMSGVRAHLGTLRNVQELCACFYGVSYVSHDACRQPYPSYSVRGTQDSISLLLLVRIRALGKMFKRRRQVSIAERAEDVTATARQRRH